MSSSVVNEEEVKKVISSLFEKIPTATRSFSNGLTKTYEGSRPVWVFSEGYESHQGAITATQKAACLLSGNRLKVVLDYPHVVICVNNHNEITYSAHNQMDNASGLIKAVIELMLNPVDALQ